MSDNQPSTSCLPIVRSMYTGLTKAEQKIADYLLQNPAEVIHMSISELAEASQSAEATIFRLSRKLGFVGFQGLKIALAGDIFSPLESVYQEVAANDSVEIYAGKIFNTINEGLQDTLKILDFSALEKAIGALAAANRIEVYGSGGSAVIAADIEHRFMRFGIPIRSYADPHLQLASAALLQPGDAVIAISHTGANIDVLNTLEVAKKSQATIIAITSYMKSPVTKVADINLHGMAREISYRSEAMASRLIHLAIVDLLYTGIMLKHPDRLIANMNKVRRAISSRRL
ncbi:sugar isomerase (sis) [Lucifera butyrica]|uniref:Sugar isomerase (Sis) n=1 Tax=Lucifera butyrica TaxID=1351585 RepID=A0A498R2S7_9FIRM|nr:MurR/RpiR family transcriptional regulator [Lucifera butyrica]VBB05070.1 sugar isomerase (sis) [Lucifera butyrica]